MTQYVVTQQHFGDKQYYENDVRIVENEQDAEQLINMGLIKPIEDKKPTNKKTSKDEKQSKDEKPSDEKQSEDEKPSDEKQSEDEKTSTKKAAKKGDE